MPRRSFAVSKSILVSLGHVLTTRPFSIGIGPKQVRSEVLNATVCTWPPVDWMNRVHRLSSLPPHGVDTSSIVLCLWKRSHSLYLPKIQRRIGLLTRNNRRRHRLRHRDYSKRRHYRRRYYRHSQYYVHRCYCPCLSLFTGESADIAEFCCSGQALHPGEDGSRRGGPIAPVGYENHDGLCETHILEI